MSIRQELFHLIEMERARQDKKWGEQDHEPERWLAIIMEELGEVAKAILQNQPAQVVIELVQTMAVIMAWLERYVIKEKYTRGFRIHFRKEDQ